MRKWIFIVATILCITGCRSQIKHQKQFDYTMNELNVNLGGGRYSDIINWFYDNIGVYPQSLQVLRDTLEVYDPNGINSMILRYFLDPFSNRGRGSDKWFGYVPLYNDNETAIESFIILSAGIDGKLDNADVIRNKIIHTSDWKSILKLYNPDEFDVDFNKAFVSYDKYDNDERQKGDKDLLIYLKRPGIN